MHYVADLSSLQRSDFGDTSSKSKRVRFEDQDIMHLMYQGRLSLGRKRNLFVLFTQVVFSFGLIWIRWFERARSEVLLHINNPYCGLPKGKLWMLFVPGLHFFPMYRLSLLILQMEVDDEYRHTSPIRTIIYSFFPPLVVAYLQASLNKHWDLHISGVEKSHTWRGYKGFRIKRTSYA